MKLCLCPQSILCMLATSLFVFLIHFKIWILVSGSLVNIEMYFCFIAFSWSQAQPYAYFWNYCAILRLQKQWAHDKTFIWDFLKREEMLDAATWINIIYNQTAKQNLKVG